MKFKYLPPDLYTAFVPPGDTAWRDWFLRLQQFLSTIDNTVTATTTVTDGSMMPYLIESDETFTVPIKKQGLFSMTIDVLGTIVIDGYLVQVT